MAALAVGMQVRTADDFSRTFLNCNQPAVPELEEWSQNLSTNVICPDCKDDPPNLIEEYSSGDMVCGDCGLVVGARIVDTHSEWRTFSNDDQNNDDPSRVGDAPNLLLKGDQLTTEVAMGDGKLSKDLRRAQNKTVNDKNNKALVAAYRQIQGYCETMSLPSSVINHTKALYMELQDDTSRNVVKSKPLDVVAAGLIFIACREFQVPRTFREVHKITSVSKKEIGKVFKLLMDWRQKNMSLNKGPGLPSGLGGDGEMTGKEAIAFVARYNSKLGITGVVASRIEALATKVDRLNTLAGRSPLSAAGAVIFFVTSLMNETKNIKSIADISGVSDSTIRTSYKFLWEKKEELVDPKWLEDGRSNMEHLPLP